MREHGCPLNNLAQEMSTQDEGFRERIARLFNHWIDVFTAVFERGKKSCYIRNDLDSRAVARFMIAVLEGCIGVYKVENSAEQWAACRAQIAVYLATLMPANSRN
jgi:TetR/AcrR family transcriptional repressor of nem operon